MRAGHAVKNAGYPAHEVIAAFGEACFELYQVTELKNADVPVEALRKGKIESKALRQASYSADWICEESKDANHENHIFYRVSFSQWLYFAGIAALAT